jgi:predicted RNA-binding Zn-ribbon protein involved in translation (DUF1610 family)
MDGRQGLEERMIYHRCPQCGAAVEEEKDTSSGRDFRIYDCTKCKWSEIVDLGIALWKALEMAKDGQKPAPQDDDRQRR